MHHIRALNIRLSTLGESHPHVALSYNHIGVCYSDKGAYDEALIYHCKALYIRLGALSDSHPDVAESYNNIGTCYSYKGLYDEASKYFKEALDILVRKFGESHPKVTGVYNNIGMCYGYKGAYEEALKYLKKALHNRLGRFDNSHPLVAMAYNNIAIYYSHMGSYDEALKYLKKALNIKVGASVESHPAVARAYNNIGVCYAIKGSYDEALEYLKKALNIQIELLGMAHPAVAWSHNNIGACYSHKGFYDEALEYHKKALFNRIGLFGESHPDVATSYNDIGFCYNYKGSYDEALEYHKKALHIRLNIFGDFHPDVAQSYANIGAYYSNKGSHDEALEYHKKALHIQKGVLGKSHPSVALSYSNIGAYYHHKKDFDKALEIQQQAIIALCGNFRNTDIASNPALNDISSKAVLLKVLKAKAQILYQKHHKTNDIDDLKLSFSTYKLATSLIDSIRFEMMGVRDKQDFMDNSMSVYDQTISIAFSLYEQTQKAKYLYSVFKIIEKSKAFLLLQALKNSEARQFANIPDTLLVIEKEINQNIGAYKKQLNEEQWKQENEQDSSKIIIWEGKVFNLKRQRDSLINYFEIKYPKYYKLKYDLQVDSVEQVQKELTNNPNKALIEYFVGDSSIYIFCITQSDINLHRVKKDSTFDQTLDEYIKTVSLDSLKTQKRSFESYTNVAFRLYQMLLEKSLQAIDTSINQLTIISDSRLGYISFNALVTQPIKKPINSYNPRSPRYLIEDYIVSYAYSATHLLEQKKENKKKKAKSPLIAFAPPFGEPLSTKSNNIHFKGNPDQIAENNNRGCSGTLDRLNHSEKEVFRINNMFKGGKLFVDIIATKENFIETARDGLILHFATHACVEDKDALYSKLYFLNDYIETYELFNMQLNANLVVLSACETGIGEIQRGEGIMSLSRGFAYAGCPSLVTSLWAVDDEATSEIMIEFYKMLKKGQGKDNALRNAQLAYINNPDKYSKEIHPYYWAAFVQMGNTKAIDLAENDISLYFVSICVFGLIGLLFLCRKDCS